MATAIRNDEKFRALWNSDLTIESIAEIYSASDPTVRRRAKEFGYGPRPRGSRRKAVDATKRQEKEHERTRQKAEAILADGLFERLTARGITPQSASKLAFGLVRAGCYADLEALAARHKQPLTRLMPLWHEVRS